jgi:hypothetical protein
LNRFFHILLSFFLLLLLADCAKIGSPAGGPRDEDPPIVLKSKPLNYSVLYEGKKIEITFDEYIKTDAIGQEMVVSPPFEDRPQILLKGKTLVIQWDEELHDSTTYTFSFGESIKDLNESNVLRNFEFVFSTGGHLDTLAVIGTVLKAFDLKPHEEKVYLTLHSDLSDSAPLKETPDFVGLADGNGNFIVNNVRPDTYRLFAVQDLNRNYKYDVPEEYIGVADSFIYLFPSLFDSIGIGSGDTLISDSTWMFADSGVVSGDSAIVLEVSSTVSFDSSIVRMDSSIVRMDSSIVRMDSSIVRFDSAGFRSDSSLTLADSLLMEEDDSLTLEDMAKWSLFVDLFLFQEDNSLQYLIEHTRKDRRLLKLRFNRPVEDTLILEPLDFDVPENWFLFEEHIMQDTFAYWIRDSLIYKKDSLTIIAHYTASDSLLQMVPFSDTLNFNFREPVKKETRRRRDRDEAAEKPETLSITANVSGGSEQDIYMPFPLIFEQPIADIDTSKIRFYLKVDTVRERVSYEIQPDPLKLRRYQVHVDWKGISNYELEFYPGAFTDLYGLSNDTTITRFRTRDPEYYSRILLNLTGVKGQKIVQVLNNKQEIVRSAFSTSDGMIEFEYMIPGEYTLKLVHDRNASGKWDTGKYLEHLQPEMVEFNPGKLNLRSNFDMEVNWEIQQQDPAVTGFTEELDESTPASDETPPGSEESPDSPDTSGTSDSSISSSGEEL